MAQPTTQQTPTLTLSQIKRFLLKNADWHIFYSEDDPLVCWNTRLNCFTVQFEAAVDVETDYESIGGAVRSAFDNEEMKKAGSGLVEYNWYDSSGRTETTERYYCDVTVKYSPAMKN